MAGRRTSLASLAGQKVDDVPGKSDPILLSLPLSKLVPTRFNPRRNFGSQQDLKEFGQRLAQNQLQPAVVVSRAGYLKLWPDEADLVGDASYVIANGERRYRASQLAGRPTLEAVHNEEVANSRASFLDAVLAENNDREDLDPIERALGIETMVIELGGADPVAEHYGKTKGWVSQQRKLLKLTPELQALVSDGTIPVRVARDLAGLPDSEQGPAWLAERQHREKAKATPRARSTPRINPGSAAPPVEQPRFTAVNQDADSTPQQKAIPADVAITLTADTEARDHQNLDPASGKEDHATDVPGQRGSPAERQSEGTGIAAHLDDDPTDSTEGLSAVPWGDPEAFVALAKERMSAQAFARATILMIEKNTRSGGATPAA